ncbi:glutathione S-transferase family protein [Sneathiella sp.]|uniref:glutathione S-transferase family protein n=1 Tax=Sneathiella sp. TaxID=1964365 RepID=UPI003566D5D4
MLKLFYFPGTVSLASHITLEEAGADYEAIRVDFLSAEQTKPEYLAINPKGRVPSLITEKGILTETPAILLYIAQRYPDAKLAPLDDIYELAQMQSFNNYLCSTLHVAHAHKQRGSRWADEESSFEDMKRKVPETVGNCYRLIEHEMFKGPWVMGEAYSTADAYLFNVSRWLEGDTLDIKNFPKIEAHRARMLERPAVQRVMPLHQR